ncbi:hypothetical protein SUGI_0605280 [Cryptomeria japonica]|nr:hypothetical protein SUGI_0605280 [Cryptomeria japonica]
MKGRRLSMGSRLTISSSCTQAAFSNPPCCTCHKFIPETIAVHKLRDRERWFTVLNYFSFTSYLKESKLYHIY